MESKAKLAGHAIHPMLIVFPLGLLSTAVIFDFMTLASKAGKFSEAAFYMIAAGILSGLIAGIFGLIDWIAIPKATRAKSIGGWHAILNAAVLLLFAISWILRRETPAQPPIGALVWSFMGFGLALISGWLGGELVERLGIGVDSGANANAPSSLSHPRSMPPQYHA